MTDPTRESLEEARKLIEECPTVYAVARALDERRAAMLSVALELEVIAEREDAALVQLKEQGVWPMSNKQLIYPAEQLAMAKKLRVAADG